MLFPTIEFGIFFPIVFLCSWLLRPTPVRWKVFMVLASYVFYGWWDPKYTLLLAASTLFNQAVVRGIWARESSAWKRTWLWVGVIGNLGALGWFKYYGFFAESVVSSLRDLGLDVTVPLVQVILPVGISFFTFQALSYVIDAYRGKVRPSSLLDFAVYLSFFPHLVAGPIVRASEFLPQLLQRPDPRYLDTSRAFRLIVAGLFKKVVVSSYLAANIVDPVFANPNGHSGLEHLFAIYGYAIQIYADFSGYTDIAIGCALLLGVAFPPNFDSPYRALTIQDFWRRWHMTLSRFLRDYLYISLGGNRGGRWKTYRNLMLTMVIGGLWHGAAWTFVVWGAIHGTVMSIERYRLDRRADAGLPPLVETPTRRVVQWLVTFHIVCLAWVFFRAQTFDAAWDMLSGLNNGGPSPLVTGMLVFTIGAMLASQFVPPYVVQRLEIAFSKLSLVPQAVLLAGFFFLLDATGPAGVAPFIYFQF